MPTITKISSQKSGKRVNLYLDGQFFCGLDLSVPLTHHLKVGQELSKEKISTLINQSLKEELFQKALNYISYRPRSEKEVRDFLLQKWKHSVSTGDSSSDKYRTQDDTRRVTLINQTIKRLKKNNFLNDREFAKWWVEQRLEFRPKGKIVLKSELIRKGVDRKVIDSVLKRISSEDEIEAAKKIFKKAIKQLKSVEPQKRKERLIRRLSSRGFSWEIIRQFIDKL